MYICVCICKHKHLSPSFSHYQQDFKCVEDRDGARELVQRAEVARGQRKGEQQQLGRAAEHWAEDAKDQVGGVPVGG